MGNRYITIDRYLTKGTTLNPALDSPLSRAWQLDRLSYIVMGRGSIVNTRCLNTPVYIDDGSETVM